MNTLDLHVDIKSSSRYPVNRDAIRSTIKSLLQNRRVSGRVLVSVSVCGDRKMKSINKQYRQKDYAADVLSFPTYDPTQQLNDEGFAQAEELGLALGDIVISYPQAIKKASEKNRYLDDVVNQLVEHSMLHLLGIHHD